MDLDKAAIVDGEGDITYLWAPITKRDDGARTIRGPVSNNDTVDLDGQIVSTAFLKRAMPGFMLWGNIRESHDPKRPVGKAIAADLSGDVPEITARIVDDQAWQKITNGVLQGFSVGIKNATIEKDARAPRGIITDGEIVEISVVDRPCASDARFDILKAVGATDWLDCQSGAILTPEVPFDDGAAVLTNLKGAMATPITPATPVTPTVAKGDLDAARRDDLHEDMFAFPKQRKEPLTDLAHARDAAARLDQVEGVSEEERREAKRRIDAALKRFGAKEDQDTPDGRRERKEHEARMKKDDDEGTEGTRKGVVAETDDPRDEEHPLTDEDAMEHDDDDAMEHDDDDAPEKGVAPDFAANEQALLGDVDGRPAGATLDAVFNQFKDLADQMARALGALNAAGFNPNNPAPQDRGDAHNDEDAPAMAGNATSAAAQEWHGDHPGTTLTAEPREVHAKGVTADEVRAIVRDLIRTEVENSLAKLFSTDDLLTKGAAAGDPTRHAFIGAVEALAATKAAEAVSGLEERLTKVEHTAQPPKGYAMAVEKGFALNPAEQSVLQADLSKSIEALPDEKKTELAAQLFQQMYRR